MLLQRWGNRMGGCGALPPQHIQASSRATVVTVDEQIIGDEGGAGACTEFADRNRPGRHWPDRDIQRRAHTTWGLHRNLLPYP